MINPDIKVIIGFIVSISVLIVSVALFIFAITYKG